MTSTAGARAVLLSDIQSVLSLARRRHGYFLSSSKKGARVRLRFALFRAKTGHSLACDVIS